VSRLHTFTTAHPARPASRTEVESGVPYASSDASGEGNDGGGRWSRIEHPSLPTPILIINRHRPLNLSVRELIQTFVVGIVHVVVDVVQTWLVWAGVGPCWAAVGRGPLHRGVGDGVPRVGGVAGGALEDVVEADWESALVWESGRRGMEEGDGDER
jgi:hypothetical protein